MIYLSTTNEQRFIYYFGIFYLKIGKFYTFFQLGKGPIMGPKISRGKSLSAGINHQQMDWYNVHLVLVNDKGAFVASSF